MPHVASAHPTASPRNEIGVATPLPLRADERAVIDAIRELPFGAVEVVVHQSRIVQIVKTEKLRVEAS
jgi:hypothetical protein